MDKYQNKYRTQSARAAWWDYGAVASYFITICTKDRRPFFGFIQNGFMCLNDIGTLEPKNKFGPQRKNLSAIVRGIKSTVTKQARLINPEFAWQTRFHDHIIRNHASYLRISEYIWNNPIKWSNDIFIAE